MNEVKKKNQTNKKQTT